MHAEKCTQHERKEHTPPVLVSGARKSRTQLRAERRPRAHSCWGHLVAAPLWVAYGANLGTLARTCDAVGACMAVPHTPHYRQALGVGNTLHVRPCLHWVHSPRNWLVRERGRGTTIVGVELAEDAVRLGDLTPAGGRTVVVLGHEHHGIPDDVWDLLDQVVEIPMVGSGASLNVAVAGSLVLYRLAGLS